ncbi:MAG: 3'-5' exonuclease [Actinobacteria bacterium]|nr:3'-5' exonuclease [Actinomycetota bacterium]
MIAIGNPSATSAGFACFDVETTGLDADRARVIEVAVVRIASTGEVVGEWTTLVDAGTGDLGRVDIHGIQPEWLESAPAFTEIAGDLAAELSDYVPVAHNAPFDIRFLESEWGRLGIGPMGLTAIDTLDVARSHGLPGRLGLLAEALEVPLDDAHQALDDSMALAGVMAAFLDRGFELPAVPTFPRALLPAPTGRSERRPERDGAPDR